MKQTHRLILITLLVLNIMVLAGQVWPAGAPPFARVINIIFLLGSLAWLAYSLFRK